MGDGNAAGERFFEFCALNNFTIMNTWLAKKFIHLATWKHPATREMHMIDYICSHARISCTDVQVMRGVTYWSDHHIMIRVKLQVGSFQRKRKRKAPTLPIAVHDP